MKGKGPATGLHCALFFYKSGELIDGELHTMHHVEKSTNSLKNLKFTVSFRSKDCDMIVKRPKGESGN